MDLLALVGFIAAVCGILSFLYVVVVGQRTLPEILRPKPDPVLPGGLAGEDRRVVTAHNLPHRGEFVNRVQERSTIRRYINTRPHVVVVHGIGGMGKSATVLEVAHELLNSENDGTTFRAIVWISARERNVRLAEFCEIIIRVLDEPRILQFSLVDQVVALKGYLSKEKVLLVVDNMDTIADPGVTTFLEALPEPSAALVTSRHVLLENARHVLLGPMLNEDATGLIRSEGQRIGWPYADRLSTERLLGLADAAGGVPLALKWAIGQMRRGRSLDAVLENLAHARGTDLFEDIFERSWNMMSKDEKIVMAAIAIHADSATAKAINALAGIEETRVRAALDILFELSMVDMAWKEDELDLARVDSNIEPRFGLHPLARSFVKANPDTGPAQQNLRDKMFDYYAKLARDEARNLDLKLESIVQVASEYTNFLNVLDWSADLGLREQYVDMAHSIDFFMYIDGHWNRCWDVCERSVRWTNDLEEQVYFLNRMILIAIAKSNLRKARDLTQQATSLLQAVTDPTGEVRALCYEGRIAAAERDDIEAEKAFVKCLELSRSHGVDQYVAIVAYYLAELRVNQGKDESVSDLLAEGMAVSIRLQWRRGIAYYEYLLGEVARRRGNNAVAEGHLHRALELVVPWRERQIVALANLSFARIAAERGDWTNAAVWSQQAVELFERLGVQERANEARAVLEKSTSRHWHRVRFTLKRS